MSETPKTSDPEDMVGIGLLGVEVPSCVGTHFMDAWRLYEVERRILAIEARLDSIRVRDPD